MDSIKISFGRHNGFMIQNSRSKSNIITRIQERYKLNIFNMFEKHYGDHLLNVLNTKPMIVCNITRGKPYILYLTKILVLSSDLYVIYILYIFFLTDTSPNV